MLTVQASYIFHRNQKRIRLQFENYGLLNKLIKSIPGARWSKTYKSWHIACNDTLYKSFKNNLPDGCLLTEIKETDKTIAPQTKTSPPTVTKKSITIKTVPANSKTVVANKIYPSALHPANQQALQQYLQCLQLKAYSNSTIKTYKNEFTAFLQTLGHTNAGSLSMQRVKDYLQYCHTTLKISENTIHSRMNALKFYYEQVLNREKFFWEIPRPKKPIQLPKILNEIELGKLFQAIGNIKHKAIIFTSYSAGLRVSEVVNLKLVDIDSKRMTVFISAAKGKKDRM